MRPKSLVQKDSLHGESWLHWGMYGISRHAPFDDRAAERVLGDGVANRFTGRLKPIASFLNASGASGSSRWLRGALPRQVLCRTTSSAMPAICRPCPAIHHPRFCAAPIAHRDGDAARRAWAYGGRRALHPQRVVTRVACRDQRALSQRCSVRPCSRVCWLVERCQYASHRAKSPFITTR